MIYLYSARGLKIVLILLTEMVTFYIRLILEKFQDFSIKKAFSKLISSLNYFHKYFHKFCKEILSGRKNKRWSGSLRKSRKLIVTSIKFFVWLLGAGKLILLCEIGWKIDTKAPLSSRSWSYCNKNLNIIFANRLADLLNMKLLKL